MMLKPLFGAGVPIVLAAALIAGSAPATAADDDPPANPKSPYSEAVKAGDFLMVSGALAAGAAVEVECWAYVGGK